VSITSSGPVHITPAAATPWRRAVKDMTGKQTIR